MINIPFLMVRIDSEKHDDSTLSRRPLTEIVREIDEWSFISKAIPDGRVKWRSKSRGGSGDDGEDDDQVGA